jgi:FtsZ-binding cell division protein ZapB
MEDSKTYLGENGLAQVWDKINTRDKDINNKINNLVVFGEEEPTDSTARIWIKESSDTETVSLPQIKDDEVNKNDTWSSSKIDSQIKELTSKNEELESELAATTDRLYSITGYDSDEIVGLQVDYTNNKFTRLAAAANLSAGSDFDKFEMYGGR